ncbi:MAG: DUF4861 family protein [Bacteroidales bacterium]|nr:DUF4861 family protein [Bacteroidales bacterium]
MKTLHPILAAAFACVLLFCPVAGAQTARSLFMRSDSLQVTEIVSPEPVIYKLVGHHGPAVENRSAAFRLYFNDSGAIDVYSKSGRQMELEKYLWYPSARQQSEEGAGCDEYVVGKTVGLGGIALWDGQQEVKLVAERRTGRVGTLRHGCFAEVIAYGVPYKGEKVDISMRIDVRDRSRIARVTARELNGRKVQFLTGVNCHPGLVVGMAPRGRLWTWGSHPAGVSKAPVPIGAALFFRPGRFCPPERTEDMLRIISVPARRIRTRIVAASTKEEELGTMDTFRAFVEETPGR